LLDTSEFLPTEDAVALAVGGLDGNRTKLARASIERLQKGRKILWYRGRSGGYCLWPHTSVNLEKACREAERQGGVRPLARSIWRVLAFAQHALVHKDAQIET